MIPLLAPIFRGELAPLGEGLQCAPSPPPGAVRVAELLHSGSRLEEVLRSHARYRRHAGTDQRAVASAWSLRYVEVLLPPVAAAASMLQHVFPLAPEQVWVRFDEHGGVIDFHLVDLGESRRGATTADRYAPLLQQHLAPLFARLAGLTRIAPKILWGNVSRHLEPIFDQGLRLAAGAAGIAQDRHWLLYEPQWPDTDLGANPLHGMRREVMRRHEGREMPLKLHRQCCLYHLLPGEGYCGACPLAPQHRKDGAEEEEAAPAHENGG